MIEKFEQRQLLTNVNGQEKVGTGGGRQPRSRRCHLTPENLTRCLHSIQTTVPLPSLLYSTSFYFSGSQPGLSEVRVFNQTDRV